MIYLPTATGQNAEGVRTAMYNFQYVSKRDAAKVKNELLEIINEVQNLVRDYFTFQFYFIGSSSRNMITYDPESNIGFDFDVNLEVNDKNENYTPSEIKQRLIYAFNQAIRRYGYCYCEDSTRVITIKKVDYFRSKIIYSCDFAIVYSYTDKSGTQQQQYIRFNKQSNSYTWEMQPHGYYTEKKADWLRANKHWQEVRNRYINKKNSNKVKKSRSLYAETINEVYNKYYSPNRSR